MAGAAGCSLPETAGGRAGHGSRFSVAGSLMLRRMDRRGHKRGLVRAKKRGTKSGSGAPPRRGFSFALSRATIGSWKENK